MIYRQLVITIKWPVLRGAITTAVIYSLLAYSVIAKGGDSKIECGVQDKWEVSLGVHYAIRDISVHYERKTDPANDAKDIGEEPTDTGFQGHGFASIRYLLNDASVIEFEYSASGINETGVVRRRVRIFGIPLRIAPRIPVQLETESIKLRYAHTLLRTPEWQLVGTVGIRDIKANATYLHADFTQQTDYYRAYLPTLGAMLSYRWNGSFALTTRVDYFPIRSKNNRGYIGDLDVGIEYRLYQDHALGLGYRYSSISYRSDREKSRGDLSYVAQGPLAYWKVRF